MKTKGFTIVELLIGIVIFTIGLISAYLLIYSAINASIKSKNEIIAINLARENIELLRNNRDSNWSKLLKWNKLDNSIVKHDPSIGEYLSTGFYKISNEFEEDTNNNPSIKIEKLSSDFEASNESYSYIKNPINPQDKTDLCFDDKNRYSYQCNTGNKKTNFYSYIKIEKLFTKNTRTNSNIEVANAYKITSNILKFEKSMTKYSVSTIITDWKK